MRLPDSNISELEALVQAELTRRQLLRRAGVAGAALAIPGVFANLSQAAALRSGQIETLTWAFPQTVDSLDAARGATAAAENATANVIEALVTYDAKGRLTPHLASSVRQPDGRTYVFKIRSGVRFSDGTPLTVDDVVYSITRMWKDKVSIFGGLFANIQSAKRTGPLELTIKLKQPSATFKFLATFLFVGQRKSMEAAGDKLGTPGALGIYTGPYTFQSFVPGDTVTLVRNDRYWGKKPAAARIVFKVFKDAATMRLALQAGEIDGAFRIPLTDVERWDRLTNANVLRGTGPVQQFYMSFDTKQAPWSDVHIRRAIAHSIDKAGILRAVFKGNGEVARTIVPTSEWASLGLSPAQVRKLYSQIPDYNFSLAKAKQELAQSSKPRGFKETVWVPSDSDPELTQIAISLAQSLKRIGVDLTVKPVPGAQFYGRFYSNKKNTGFNVIRNGPTFLDPADFPLIMLRKPSVGSTGFHSANYFNPRVETLLDRSETTLAVKVRQRSIIDALKIAAPDVPYVPVVFGGGAMAISKKYEYTGFHPWAYLIQLWALRIRER